MDVGLDVGGIVKQHVEHFVPQAIRQAVMAQLSASCLT
jgi:hypothetical protein